MREDIVETLRNNADHYMTVEGAAGLVHLLTDAADVIEAKQEEAQALKGTVAFYRKQAYEAREDAKKAQVEAYDELVNIFGKRLELQPKPIVVSKIWVSVKDKMPDFHITKDGVMVTMPVVFKTEWGTIHLGYCFKTFVEVQTTFGSDVQEHNDWKDQRGDRIEDVTKWFYVPGEK